MTGRRVLVSPPPALHIHVIDGEAELDELVGRLKLGGKLRGNLRQLCGWDKVGADHKRRYEASGWMLRDDIFFLRRDGSDELVPVTGSVPKFFKSVVQTRGDMPFSEGSLGKCLPSRETGKQSIEHLKGGWRVVQRPMEALRLTTGSSLKGLRVGSSGQARTRCHHTAPPVCVTTSRALRSALVWQVATDGSGVHSPTDAATGGLPIAASTPPPAVAQISAPSTAAPSTAASTTATTCDFDFRQAKISDPVHSAA